MGIRASHQTAVVGPIDEPLVREFRVEREVAICLEIDERAAHNQPSRSCPDGWACGQIALACTYVRMEVIMATDSSESSELLRRAAAGDREAMNELFSRYRDRLRAMVRLRLNRRLQGRVDPSDVLQEAFLEISKGFADYVRQPTMPFFLWLRHVTAQKLIAAHRHHLGTQMRDAGQEVSLYRGVLPQASSVSLAAQLMGRWTSASDAAIRAETQIRLQEILNGMDPMDREILALRHFEMLSNEETAQVLGIKKSAASNRYIRALKRLKEIVAGIPGFME
jgi:RNA polymerase sigma-70 factor (ECF subfamily)